MYAEIASAIASAKTALDLAKAANDLANYNELVTAVSEVNTKLMDATAIALASQEKQSALIEQVDVLKQELVKLKNWEAQSKDYILQAVGVEQLHFAQVYKPAVHSSKVRHWACAKCFQEQKLYILSANDNHSYQCPNCNTVITPIVPGGELAPIDTAYE